MQLYAINATPVSTNNTKEQNNLLCDSYASEVSILLQNDNIDGFTIYPVNGYWKGISENSYRIELALQCDDPIETKTRVMLIAEKLKTIYKQDAVMVTYPDNTVVFI